MLELVAEYGSVIAASMLRLFLGAGLSLAYGHHPIELWLLNSIGSTIGVSGCLFLGNKLQSWWFKKTRAEEIEPAALSRRSPSLFKQIWKKYGLQGLAVASLFVGTIPSVAIALVSGLDKPRIFFYLVSGKLAWATVIAIIGEMPI